MTGAYQLIAETRPRVKQDVLYTRTPQGVLLHNSESGFQLTSASAYRFACVLMPHLTGERTVAELCAGLGAGQQAMVTELVTALLDRGFARDVPVPAADAVRVPPALAEEFSSQIAYIDHYSGRAEEGFLAFRGARVAVLGDGPMARWCVLGLIRNGAAEVGAQPWAEAPQDESADLGAELERLAGQGCPVRMVPLSRDRVDWSDLRGFDVVVVAADARQTTRLMGAGIPPGVTLLPATIFGGQALVGPLMSADRRGCWVCAALRRGANLPPGPAADLWSSLVVPANGADAAPGRALAAMLGNLLAYEVFRLTSGALPAETDGYVVVQDLDSMDSATEPLLVHPRCPFCAEGAPAAASVAGVEPQSPVTATVADADGPEAMFEELARVSLLVQPTVGVFTGFDDDTVDQLPLKVGRVRLGIGHTGRRTVTAFDVHHVVGARLSALYRAAELYAEHVVPFPELARRADVELPAVDAADLAIASGNGAAGPGTPGRIPATSLLSGERFLVPRAAVRAFGPANRSGLCLPTSAGSGAGRSMPEALGRALGTALGHDTLRRALAAGHPVRRVPLEDLGPDRELGYLAGAARNLDLELELLDLTGPDTAVHVLLARAVDDTVAGAGEPVWALAGDPVWQRAARDAMCDLIGRVQLARQEPDQPVDTGGPFMSALDPYTVQVKADASVQLDARTSWSAALDVLRGQGRDALAVPVGSEDLATAGLTVVRVLLVGRD